MQHCVIPALYLNASQHGIHLFFCPAFDAASFMFFGHSENALYISCVSRSECPFLYQTLVNNLVLSGADKWINVRETVRDTGDLGYLIGSN